MFPFSNEKGIVGKLPWKVEWAAKWKVLGVTDDMAIIGISANIRRQNDKRGK